MSGTIKVEVHYYEDGNVRMSTSKKVDVSGQNADLVVREIAKAENKFQEELNRGFTSLAEGSFKGLRRQLPVTRQRVSLKPETFHFVDLLILCRSSGRRSLATGSVRTLLVGGRGSSAVQA